MQYKIPIQIENEDTIVAGLSIRQILILMVWFGIGYSIYKSLEQKIGPEPALVFGLVIAAIGVVIAYTNKAEMTFLPLVLNLFRLKLNETSRYWSMGTDSYTDMEIGYIALDVQKESHANAAIDQVLDDEAALKI